MDRLETHLAATRYTVLRQPVEDVFGDLARDYRLDDVTNGAHADAMGNREVSNSSLGVE
ncbi:hypothetical protein ACGFSB_21785 [Streptomyces sp. NPDC048441]|uniref:hypothetical protein n=1 Tax=Streptomyces sp. NPDC048441 TaxID=3365552 RepID=UPI00371BA70F